MNYSPPAIVQRVLTVAPRLHHGRFAAPSFQWNLGVRMLAKENKAVFQTTLQRLTGLAWQMTRHLWQLMSGTPSKWMLSGRLLVVSHYGSPPLTVSASHQTPTTPRRSPTISIKCQKLIINDGLKINARFTLPKKGGKCLERTSNSGSRGPWRRDHRANNRL